MGGKRDLIWVEAARTVAMVLVVLVHVNDMAVGPIQSKSWWSVGISVFVRWTVPLFFMVSGFLLGRGYHSRDSQPSMSSFFVRKFNTLIVPFLVWNLISMLVFRLAFGQPIWSHSTLWLMVTGYLQLYFVFVLLQFFVIYRVVEPYLAGRGLWWVLVSALVLSLAFYINSDLTVWTQGDDKHFYEWHYGKAFVGWSLFFFWGVVLGRRPNILDMMTRWRWLIGSAALVFFGVYYYETYLEMQRIGAAARQFFLISGLFFQFAGANFVLVLLYRLDYPGGRSWLLNWLGRFGADTFGVYLCHIVVLIGLIRLYSWLGLPGAAWVKAPVLLIATWFVCQGFLGLSRLPGLGFLHRLLFGLGR